MKLGKLTYNVIDIILKENIFSGTEEECCQFITNQGYYSFAFYKVIPGIKQFESIQLK